MLLRSVVKELLCFSRMSVDLREHRDWSQSTYLLLDKGVNPAEAFALTKKITHGQKQKFSLGS